MKNVYPFFDKKGIKGDIFIFLVHLRGAQVPVGKWEADLLFYSHSDVLIPSSAPSLSNISFWWELRRLSGTYLIISLSTVNGLLFKDLTSTVNSILPAHIVSSSLFWQ